MYAIAGAGPALALAVVAWIIMGVRRPHPDGPFTAATAVSWYAHVMAMVAAVMTMVGGALAVKAAFGFADLAYSYPSPDYYGPVPVSVGGPSVSRDDDLTLGITLFAVGLLVLLVHLVVVRAVARREGGAPAWVTHGTLVLFTFFVGIVAVVATVSGVYEAIGYRRGIGDHHFGEAAGLALVFLPTWIVATLRLVRTAPGSRLLRGEPRPPTVELPA